MNAKEKKLMQLFRRLPKNQHDSALSALADVAAAIEQKAPSSLGLSQATRNIALATLNDAVDDISCQGIFNSDLNDDRGTAATRSLEQVVSELEVLFLRHLDPQRTLTRHNKKQPA